METDYYPEVRTRENDGRLFSRVNKKILAIIIMIISISAAIAMLCAGTSEKNEANIIINEVMTKNTARVNGEIGSPDWIELYNPTDMEIDLAGYKIFSNNSEYTFGGNKIEAGGYLVVYADSNVFQGTEDLVVANIGLSGKGETVRFSGSDGALISQVKIPALLNDVSYARRRDGSYGYCISATPGGPNDEAGIMTFEELNARTDSEDVIITEVLPKGKGGESWVELYNNGRSAASLGDFYLTDSEADPSKWHIQGGILEPGRYMVIYFDGDTGGTGLRAPFGLGGAKTGVYLYGLDGRLRSHIEWQKGLPGGVSVIADGKYTACPTPGSANSENVFMFAAPVPMDDNDPVRLNEALVRNRYGLLDGSGKRYAWAEIYNSGIKPVSLSGYYLSDDKNDLFKWAFPDSIIQPGGYITVLFTGEIGKASELRASFRLNGEDTGLYLTCENGMRVDTLCLPQAPEDVSVGRGSGGKTVFYRYPTPGKANVNGIEDVPAETYPDLKGLYISEVCAAGKVKNGGNDWIELHNGGEESISLGGYYLSDDQNDIKKWKLPEISVEPDGYAVIEASETAQSAGIANFGISSSGETIVLSDPDGNVIDAFDTGVLSAGLTSGRPGDSPGRVFFTAPTRGAKNSPHYAKGYVSKPVFSETGLYKNAPFSLKITCATPGAVIYYTTDGSVPTSSSKKYTEPIRISENTVIRAAAYADGLIHSEDAAKTFIFDAPHTLPVFCISLDPGDLNTLIRVNKIGQKPEYESYVEYYETGGMLGVSFPSGIRPKGRASLANPQKSFTLELRGSYGRKEIEYPFFEGNKVDYYSALTLRNSGQDNRAARIRDSYFQKLSGGLNLDTIDTKPVIVYLNGKYYGLSDLDEEQDITYFASHYGLEPGNIEMIDKNGTVIEGTNEEFLRIMKMARTLDTSDDENFAEFSKYVDADACMDYLIAHIYFGDGDVINQRYWRAKDYTVKWRPYLFDLDWSMRFNDPYRNKFSRYFTSVSLAGNGSPTQMYIFQALKKNKAWRERFIERFVQLALTQFCTERMLEIFDETVDTMKPEMPLHIARFHTPRSMASWQDQISKLRSALKKRQSIALRQLQQYFHIPNEKMSELINKYKRSDSSGTF